MSHDHNSAGASHGNTKQYTIGFILSVILTVIPFGMVMAGGFGRGIVMAVINYSGCSGSSSISLLLAHELIFRATLERDCIYLYSTLYCCTSSRLCMDYELLTLQHDDLN